MKWVLRALGIVLLVAASLYAFTFLIIFSARSAQATFRVETREAHPDYVFVINTEVLRWEAGYGWKLFPEVRFAEITPNDPLTLELDRWPNEVVDGTEWRERTFLGIVPRAVAAQYKTAKECVDAGACSDTDCFYWNRPVPPWFNTNKKVAVTYRVQRAKSGDGLEIVQTSWSPLWQWGFLPGVLLLCGAVWAVKRTRRSVLAPPAS